MKIKNSPRKTLEPSLNTHALCPRASELSKQHKEIPAFEVDNVGVCALAAHMVPYSIRLTHSFPSLVGRLSIKRKIAKNQEIPGLATAGQLQAAALSLVCSTNLPAPSRAIPTCYSHSLYQVASYGGELFSWTLWNKRLILSTTTNKRLFSKRFPTFNHLLHYQVPGYGILVSQNQRQFYVRIAMQVL